MMINTKNLHTIESHLRTLINKEGYTKVFNTLNEYKNVWTIGYITLSFDEKTVLFKGESIQLLEHGFKGYEYLIQELPASDLPILSQWHTAQTK